MERPPGFPAVVSREPLDVGDAWGISTQMTASPVSLTQSGAFGGPRVSRSSVLMSVSSEAAWEQWLRHWGRVSEILI